MNQFRDLHLKSHLTIAFLFTYNNKKEESGNREALWEIQLSDGWVRIGLVCTWRRRE